MVRAIREPAASQRVDGSRRGPRGLRARLACRRKKETNRAHERRHLPCDLSTPGYRARGAGCCTATRTRCSGSSWSTQRATAPSTGSSSKSSASTPKRAPRCRPAQPGLLHLSHGAAGRSFPLPRHTARAAVAAVLRLARQARPRSSTSQAGTGLPSGDHQRGAVYHGRAALGCSADPLCLWQPILADRASDPERPRTPGSAHSGGRQRPAGGPSRSR